MTYFLILILNEFIDNYFFLVVLYILNQSLVYRLLRCMVKKFILIMCRHFNF